MCVGKYSKRNEKQSTEISISNYFMESSHKSRLPSVESCEVLYLIPFDQVKKATFRNFFMPF